MKEIVKTAAHVTPTARQLAWFELGFYGFIHFTVNTYTGREWGEGDEKPTIFNPYDLDCDEWVLAMQEAGMRGVILTAKHHDGFCLWPSKYTEHSVKNSPWRDGKGDVVRELSDACHRHGMKFGIYLSPWDRNSPVYGTPEYNDYYAAQLEELLTGYGELFCIWQDNACAPEVRGKMVYDFKRFNALIRKHQPNAFIFNDYGPDVRWCGNEAGAHREEEWAVVPYELCSRAENPVPITPAIAGGYEKPLSPTDKTLGRRDQIARSSALVFAPAEFDTSIRRGWFYHPEEEPRRVDELFSVYLNTVGANACLNLNVPPMPSGRFDPRDIAVLKALGERIRRELIMEPATVTLTERSEAHTLYRVTLARPMHLRYVTVREDIAKGQRIEAFRLLEAEGGTPFFEGRTVGNRKICPVDVTAKEFLLEITSARDTVELAEVTVSEAALS